MKAKRYFLLLMILNFSFSYSQTKKIFTPEDLYKIKKVSSPQISPDGQWIAYTVSVPSLSINKYTSSIWLIPISGGTSKQLTGSRFSDQMPRWSPDGKHIAFISDRDGIDNLYLINIYGGEAVKVSDFQSDLDYPIWSSNGNYIFCSSRFIPDNKKDKENWTENELPKCKARTIDHLLFRQWNEWLGDERNQLLRVDIKSGRIKNVTPEDYDVPPVSLTSDHDFDISPDGSEICYVKNEEAATALSTNHDLFIKNCSTLDEIQITTNPALDSQPHYSPDGKYIAYTAMEIPGYESDRKILSIYDTGSKILRKLTTLLDRSVGEIIWAPNGKEIYFNARDRGRNTIFKVSPDSKVEQVTDEGFNTELQITPDGRKLIFLRSFNYLPNEIFSYDLKSGKSRQLTFTNADVLAELNIPKLEEFWFEGAGGTKVQGYLQKPPNFNPDKKYPVVLCIHGGPQNMWGDRFMTRWFTFPLVSSPGFVGIFINPRGSSGFGSKFREEVSKDFGGKCYEDLMKGLDYAIDNYDFIDDTKQAAIGGSFGGYSVNWINGNTDRFKCIVSHAGVFNLTSLYGSTEELWWPAWDFGKSPWETPELYAKWSPHTKINNFHTPTLVTQGQLDYRIPLSESLQLFTALQVKGIPSRLVYFPDEGHVITKPQNNVRWWKEIHNWLKKYLLE